MSKRSFISTQSAGNIERERLCAFKLCCWEPTYSVIVTAKKKYKERNQATYIIHKNSTPLLPQHTVITQRKEYHSVRRFLSQAANTNCRNLTASVISTNCELNISLKPVLHINNYGKYRWPRILCVPSQRRVIILKKNYFRIKELLAAYVKFAIQRAHP